MRISDWSSDVCSSDLLLGSTDLRVGDLVALVRVVGGGARGPTLLAGDAQARQRRRAGARALVGQVVGEAGEHSLALAPSAKPQIGRASSRERRGPYV